VTGAHFHPVDQFQVFFPSPGAWYQRSQISTILLHYADAYTTYGPFGTSDHGFSFFTLRARSTVENHFMPGSRDRMIRHSGRNIHVAVDRKIGKEQSENSFLVTKVIESDSDELAAYFVTAGAGARVTSPEADNHGGVYYCLLNGSVIDGQSCKQGKALAWRHPGETPIELQAGEGGFEALVLQFPVQSSEGG
jgi:hypothetical protein